MVHLCIRHPVYCLWSAMSSRGLGFILAKVAADRKGKRTLYTGTFGVCSPALPSSPSSWCGARRRILSTCHRTTAQQPSSDTEGKMCFIFPISYWHSVKHKGSGRLGLALLSLQRVVFSYDLLYEE